MVIKTVDLFLIQMIWILNCKCEISLLIQKKIFMDNSNITKPYSLKMKTISNVYDRSSSEIRQRF